MKRASSFGVLLMVIAPWLSGQAVVPHISGVSNTASGTAEVASGSWVSIYGSNLSVTTRSWQSSDIVGGVLPTSLDGVSVTINGKKAAVAYISPTQINVQAPADTATGSVPVQVTNAAGSGTSTATLKTYAPALFTFAAKYVAARHNTDGVYVAPAGYFGAAATSRAATPGEILQVYATGLGPTKPAVAPGQTVTSPAPLADTTSLKVTVGGTDAAVQYAGLVAPGLYQLNVVVPMAADGDLPITLGIAGASAQTGVALTLKNPSTTSYTLTLGPSGRTIRCGTTLALTTSVANTQDQAVTWQVNSIPGGNATVGTVSAGGVYTAPAILPAGGSVTVTAISHFNPASKASITITLQNPLPVITSVGPNPINPGNTTLTLNGTGFATGATVTFAGATVPATFVSDTQLTVSGTVAMPFGRLAAVKVTNPNPGGSTSPVVAVPVRPAAEKMDYASAVRFLDLATWGPTPQAVVELQSMGLDAWLAAQFAKTSSVWPDPYTSTETMARLQTAFWNVALTGDDQLRQRVALALAEILVVSAAKDIYHAQMVSYQRLLGDAAFGNYRDLMTAITLNPAMGDYLDMVNNEKANATAGTVANENYARELMQLFSIGLVQLDAQGQPITSGGAPLVEYDQATIGQMAKVMTGWTYGKTPGFASQWKNMAYYFAPMVAFEDHHDTTQKALNLPSPCTIAAGGTAAADLKAALDCLFQQDSLAPFVSYRLIQRLVLSNPSPGYVGRVSAVFKSSQGDLPAVVKAILTDAEAQREGTGKLMEPILYSTNLLRALNAKITAPDALTTQNTSMGQTPLASPTVFSFFMPEYTLPNVTPAEVAPEFMGLNASTALARANFAYRVATNGISSGIQVDLANWQDLAANPGDLVEAINQALFRGAMDSQVRAALVSAASGSTNMLSRVRSALYAAAASPQYQVKR